MDRRAALPGQQLRICNDEFGNRVMARNLTKNNEVLAFLAARILKRPLFPKH